MVYGDNYSEKFCFGTSRCRSAGTQSDLDSCHLPLPTLAHRACGTILPGAEPFHVPNAPGWCRQVCWESLRTGGRC